MLLPCRFCSFPAFCRALMFFRYSWIDRRAAETSSRARNEMAAAKKTKVVCILHRPQEQYLQDVLLGEKRTEDGKLACNGL